MRWVDFDEPAARAAAAELREQAVHVQQQAATIDDALTVEWHGPAREGAVADGSELAAELRRAAREMHDSASAIDGAIRQARALDEARAEADRQRRAREAERQRRDAEAHAASCAPSSGTRGSSRSGRGASGSGGGRLR